jgi:hypothetical protein
MKNTLVLPLALILTGCVPRVPVPRVLPVPRGAPVPKVTPTVRPAPLPKAPVAAVPSARGLADDIPALRGKVSPAERGREAHHLDVPHFHFPHSPSDRERERDKPRPFPNLP